MGIVPSFVKHDHDYTRSDVPWLIEQNRDARGETTDGKRFGWKLFHYLSGGGMSTFGRSIDQEVADRRQNRVLLGAAVFATLWLVFWLV